MRLGHPFGSQGCEEVLTVGAVVTLNNMKPTIMLKMMVVPLLLLLLMVVVVVASLG
jgi:hypothetical protein